MIVPTGLLHAEPGQRELSETRGAIETGRRGTKVNERKTPPPGLPGRGPGRQVEDRDLQHGGRSRDHDRRQEEELAPLRGTT